MSSPDLSLGARSKARLILSLTRVEMDVERFDDPEHPSGCKLLNFWYAHKGRGKMLKRSDLPAREILDLMPNLFILEPVSPAGEDWRFRLFGQGLAEILGGDPTGLQISQIYSPHQVEHNAALYRDRSQSCLPFVSRGRILGIERDYMPFEVTNVPIESEAGGPRMFLGGMFVLD